VASFHFHGAHLGRICCRRSGVFSQIGLRCTNPDILAADERYVFGEFLLVQIDQPATMADFSWRISSNTCASGKVFT